MLKIVIDARPLTFNNAYSQSKTGRRFLTQTGKDFKEVVYWTTVRAYKEQGFLLQKEHYLRTEYFFYIDNLFTKKGELNKNKPDTDGCIKLVQDSICKALKIDDYLILDHPQVFMNQGDNKIVAILTAHNLSDKKTFQLPDFF